MSQSAIWKVQHSRCERIVARPSTDIVERYTGIQAQSVNPNAISSISFYNSFSICVSRDRPYVEPMAFASSEKGADKVASPAFGSIAFYRRWRRAHVFGYIVEGVVDMCVSRPAMRLN